MERLKNEFKALIICFTENNEFKKYCREKMKELFVFTAIISILNLIAVVAYSLGNSLTFPRYGALDPTRWYFLYPCITFQIYWWSNYFQLF